MRLIATHLVDQFCVLHPTARVPLARWMQALTALSCANLNQLKQAFRHADYAVPFTIFNIGGNNYRVISRIEYQSETLEICRVLTHAEYDKWTRQFRAGKMKP